MLMVFIISFKQKELQFDKHAGQNTVSMETFCFMTTESDSLLRFTNRICFSILGRG